MRDCAGERRARPGANLTPPVVTNFDPVTQGRRALRVRQGSQAGGSPQRRVHG